MFPFQRSIFHHGDAFIPFMKPQYSVAGDVALLSMNEREGRSFNKRTVKLNVQRGCLTTLINVTAF